MERRLTRWTCGVVVTSLMAGCASSRVKQDHKPPVPFRNLYRAWEEGQAARAESVPDSQKLTFSVQGMEAGAFARYLTSLADLGVVLDQEKQFQTVTLSVRDASYAEVLELFARQVGGEVSRVGSTWFIGDLRPQDLGVFVRRSVRLSPEDLSQVLGIVGSGVTRGRFVADDGLIVVADQVQVLRRVAELVEAVDQAETVAWCVQLYVLSLSDDSVKDLGIDGIPAVNVAAVVAGASGGLTSPASGVSAVAELDAVLRAVSQGSRSKLLADPLLVVRDGQLARMERGRRLPVRLSTVDVQQGSTTTTGRIQTFNAGMTLEATVRESSRRTARLKLSLMMSDLDGFSEGLPILQTDQIETEADVVSGGVYLLGALDRSQERESWSRWLQFGQKSERSSGVLQVWARVFRIGSQDGGGGGKGPAGADGHSAGDVDALGQSGETQPAKGEHDDKEETRDGEASPSARSGLPPGVDARGEDVPGLRGDLRSSAAMGPILLEEMPGAVPVGGQGEAYSGGSGGKFGPEMMP